eukprot:SAG31_NODE_46501_length_254_cov_0.670968_1_plen_27_part_01
MPYWLLLALSTLATVLLRHRAVAQACG